MPMGKIDDAYTAERARVITTRLPYASLGFIATMACAWIFERQAHPERSFVYGIILLLEIVVCLLAILFSRWSRLSDRSRIDAVVAAMVALAALITSYHITAPGELDVLLIALTYLVVGTMVLFPWGFRGQATIGAAAIVGFALAVVAGVPSIVPIGVEALGLTFIVAFSGAAARLDEHAKRTLFAREIELREANEELRHEVAERKRAEGLIQEKAEIAAALARVGKTLISALDQPVVLERLCEVSAEVLECEVSYTLLWQPEEDVFVPVAGYGATPEEQEVARVVKVPREPMGVLLGRLENDDAACSSTVPAGDLRPPVWENVPPQLCIALRRRDQIIGIQVASYRDKTPSFTEKQFEIARGIGQLASLALQNVRLVEELERASRLKSEFVSTMSHELRTPLNVIIGYDRLLLEGEFGALTAEQSEPIRRIDQNAEQLLELITATLDLSRLEAGTLDLDWTDLLVAALIDEINAETRELQKKPGVSFGWHVAGALPTIRTDRLKLKVVLKNLFTNAVKFTDRGSIDVYVERRDDGVEFRVSDTGIGISSAEHAAIFEAFHQADGSSTRRHGGVGLGLHIVRRLADLLGATVSVESQVGRGSTFRVQHPRLPALAARKAESASDLDAA
jgi:signal transduction histidine kinase